MKALRKLRAHLAIVALIGAFVTGCGDKPEQTSATPVTAPATGASPSAASAPTQGKISTGADPDKAPAYPNMYGKPAGAK